MEIDPVLKLALGLYQGTRSAYALLLGSGISSAAGIQTGWGITLDLAAKLATASGEQPLPSPEEWYTHKYGRPPDYDALLDELTQTPTERQTLLRQYFEPTEEERQAGNKQPTLTHRAIARLVKNGFVRVILTTNFDRLMETALRDEGVEPNVISGDDTLAGAIPFVHSPCTVVKLHGDYLDTRIKNTPEELAQYSDSMNGLLDRILDEFGLIVCGWSGIWDTALKAAILRCPNRRFSTYWLARGGTVDTRARDVVERRSAEIITIETADGFFRDLDEKVTALEQSLRLHPLSVATAVATVKRYLPEPAQRVRLHDLLTDETERVVALFQGERFDVNTPWSDAEFHARLRLYEEGGERLWAMLAAVGYHGGAEYRPLLTRASERLMREEQGNGVRVWRKLLDYPSVLALYVARTSAVAAKRFDNLAAVLRDPLYWDTRHERSAPVIGRANALFGLGEVGQALQPDAQRASVLDVLVTPTSDHLFHVVRPWVRDYLPGDREYDAAFDMFELVLNLTYMDIVYQYRSPYGRYALKYFGWMGVTWDTSLLASFLREEVERGDAALLVRAGFFSGSAERLQEVAVAQTEWLTSLRS